MTGKVVNILSFGAQVELAPNKKGLIHISKLMESRVDKVEDVVKLGDEVTVKVIKVDERDGKIDLSMRPSDVNGIGVPEETQREKRERSPRPRFGRNDRGDRSERGDRQGRNRR